jgi:hypothetical protein
VSWAAAVPRQGSWLASIVSAIEGQYGDFHRTSRTRGSTLWINPLMALCWCFRLGPVVRRILYLDAVKETHSMWDMVETINAFRSGDKEIRERRVIPDNSFDRRLSR